MLLKTNQLQSVQGYGKQRTHKNICSSKKQKSVGMATLVARCCKKTNQLQSAQGVGGMESKEPINIFISLRNMSPKDVAEKLTQSNLHRGMESQKKT